MTNEALENFIRVGDDYFEIIYRPDKNGQPKRVLCPRKKGTITDDYGKHSLQYINKYKGFCLVPSHIDYQQTVGEFYNQYYALDYTPMEEAKEEDCPATLKMIRHIFGEKLDVGLDYLQLLYTRPAQNLPVLCLVSAERNTGKSTFGQWLLDIYGHNGVKLGNGDLANDFNAFYIQKLLIVIDETSIDKRIVSESVKRMSTEQGEIVVNAKGINQSTSEFIGKFVFISNLEENFMHIGKGENRYLVLKIPPLESDNPTFLQDLKAEIPAFLGYIKSRELVHHKKTRMWFDFEEIKTDQLARVIEANKSYVERAIVQLVRDTFEKYDEIVLRMSAQDIFDEIKDLNRKIDKQQVIDALKNEMHYTPKKSSRYKFFSLKKAQYTEEIPEPDPRNNVHYEFLVDDFLGVGESERRTIGIVQKDNETREEAKVRNIMQILPTTPDLSTRNNDELPF